MTSPLLSPAAWLAEHGALLGAIGSVSVLLLALSVFATPWLLARLPVDYFRLPRGEASGERGGVRRLLLLIARNVAGVLFMVLGLVMLVTPGPGLIGLLLGLSLCEFPGKHVLVRRFAAHPDVFASLNWLRRRTGSPPFRHPHAD